MKRKQVIHHAKRAVFGAIGIVCSLFNYCLFAEKVLSYDEEKGIIFIDKDQTTAPVKKPNQPPAKSSFSRVGRETQERPSNGKLVDASIQRGRQKDPPEIYFESGLQYFKNRNFDDALRNFTHADSLDPQPKYALWMGKTFRQLNKNDRLLFTMNRIVTTYPESDVADDALFEIAFYYQTNNNYDMAMKTYTKLAEQYPFGTSFSNGENFREIAYKQCQTMRAEMITIFNALGFKGEDPGSLISAFQKSQCLNLTGTGNAETIVAMRTMYNDYLKMEAVKALRRERLDKFQIAAFMLCGVLFFNCIFLLLCNRKIAAQSKQLATLKQTLFELSMDAL
jgi:tetratricopeptide (TPR) repeat protein